MAGFDFMAEEEALEAESAPAGRKAAFALAANLLPLLMDAICNAEGNFMGFAVIAFW